MCTQPVQVPLCGTKYQYEYYVQQDWQRPQTHVSAESESSKDIHRYKFLHGSGVSASLVVHNTGTVTWYHALVLVLVLAAKYLLSR